HAGGPLVVAGAVFGIPVRTGIADALIDCVGVGIIGRGLPDRGAAVFPALLAVLPGLVAGFAGARDRIGAPHALSGIEVGAVDEATDAVFAAGRADDGDVAHEPWRQRQSLRNGGICDLALPDLLAGRLVGRDEPAIKRDRDHLVLPERDAAVVDAATGDVTGPGLVGFRVHFPFDDALLPVA